MKIWKNTSTLDGFDDGLNFTESKNEAEIALLGSKPINLEEMPKLKGIFRAGISRDNVPEKDALTRGVIVRYPSDETINIIYEETAMFTCGLINNINGFIRRIPDNNTSSQSIFFRYVISTNACTEYPFQLWHFF
jgi:phosphoglycerate dehydrogenase-like enzyme